MERRELFSSLTSSFKEEKKESVIRPPYYNDEALFETQCATCEGLCAQECETEIIQIDENNTPVLDFSKSGCTYCDKCAQACPSDVLKEEYKSNISVKIEINTLSCLSWKSVMCFSCKDPCLDNAIDFTAMFKPTINDNCTSCGFCISICPADAIKSK